MMHDYEFALRLQKQFEFEANAESPDPNLTYASPKLATSPPNGKGLIDPSWELVDPTPNIHNLFVIFNKKFFWNTLLAVCVDWSKRMTSCAGICSYQGRGGMCRITLSEPLLKLRPRKDLVETLLHEMIHAYLFVTANNKDREGHGPEFHKHMYRINGEAGTHITVYHTFHDEVRLYKTHWWKCDGPCQHRAPYFGTVKRAMNRAPGPNDCWFAEHSRNCGGTFIKVKEPEKKPKTTKGKAKTISKYPNIDQFLTPKGKTGADSVKKPIGGNVMGLNGPVNINKVPSHATTFINNTKVENIGGFKNLGQTCQRGAVKNASNSIVINKKPSTVTSSSDSAAAVINKPVEVFSGAGHSLKTGNTKENRENDYSAVRNHWLNKFSSPKETPVATQTNKRPSSASEHDKKKVKTGTNSLEINEDVVNCPICGRAVPSREINSHLDQCLGESQPEPAFRECPTCSKLFDKDELQQHIENVCGDMDETGDWKKSEETVSCLVCTKRVAKSDLNAHLDECMDSSIFEGPMDEEECVNDVHVVKKYSCPCCCKMFALDAMSDHIEKCINEDGENQRCLMESFDSDEF